MGEIVFYDNFLKACNLIGKAPTTVLSEIGISKSANTRWRAGEKPTSANVLKLADYFGVTPAELLGDASPSVPDFGTISLEDQQLLEAYHQALPDLQAAVRRVLNLPERETLAPSDEAM